MIAHEFVPTTLASLDQLQAQLAVFPFFVDERPLRGPAALADWRLDGALSRKLMAGYLDGSFGELGIVASPPKLRFDGILLVGLGRSEAFDDLRATAANELIARTVEDARVTTMVLGLPGRSLDRLPALRAMQLWLQVEPEETLIEEVSILEPPEEHRALASMVDGLRRQADSPLG